jgi:hypothetical protein
MPPNNTIVAKLTADPRDMQRGFAAGGQAAEQFGNKLDGLDRKLRSSFNSPRGGAGGGGRFGGNLANGALELSRGLEDASVGFQLNGIQGAVGGASNNFSQFAFILGGPVAGAIAGLAAAALPTLVNQLFGAGESAAESKKKIDDLRDSIERLAEQAKQRVHFEGLLENLPDTKHLDATLKDRQLQIREIDAQLKDVERERRSPQQPAPPPAFETIFAQDARIAKEFEDAARRKQEVDAKQNKLLEERARLEMEVNQLIKKRPELQDQDEFEKKFKAEGEKIKKDGRDIGQIQNVLQSKQKALGAKLDPLEGLNVPRGLGSEVRSFLDNVDAFEARKKNRTSLATTIESGSAAAASALFQDKQRSQEQEASQKLQKTAEEIVKKLDDMLKQNKEAQEAHDTVNLDG